MEYVRGRTLRDMLTDAPSDAARARRSPCWSRCSPRSPPRTAPASIHRDIKPENVLIAEAPGGTSLVDAVVKVADFGLARAVEASADDGDGQLLATVAYVAPELVTDGHADPRSDVYSVGIVLFEMLTGRVPYDGGKPIEVAWRHVDEDVPAPSQVRARTCRPSSTASCARATNRDPARRPADAGAMLAEVQAAHDELEASASLRGSTLLAPTVVVDQVPPARSGDLRDRIRDTARSAVLVTPARRRRRRAAVRSAPAAGAPSPRRAPRRPATRRRLVRSTGPRSGSAVSWPAPTAAARSTPRSPCSRCWSRSPAGGSASVATRRAPTLVGQTKAQADRARDARPASRSQYARRGLEREGPERHRRQAEPGAERPHPQAAARSC